MTEQLYRADAYQRDCTARVLAVNERGGIVLDRTVFYAASADSRRQGHDRDRWRRQLPAIATTVYTPKRRHRPCRCGRRDKPAAGQNVCAVLDWDHAPN